MAKYKIVFQKRFKKDLRLCIKRGLEKEKLKEVVFLLSEGKTLPKKYKDHSLIGSLRKYRECHITPDWLLIYEKEQYIKIISLVRTGTHADLFKK